MNRRTLLRHFAKGEPAEYALSTGCHLEWSSHPYYLFCVRFYRPIRLDIIQP